MRSKPLSKTYLEEVKKGCDEATNGPWVSIIEGRDQFGGSSVIVRGTRASEEDLYLSGGTPADQEFVAHARQDIPLLLSEIERLNKLLDEKSR